MLSSSTCLAHERCNQPAPVVVVCLAFPVLCCFPPWWQGLRISRRRHFRRRRHQHPIIPPQWVSEDRLLAVLVLVSEGEVRLDGEMCEAYCLCWDIQPPRPGPSFRRPWGKAAAAMASQCHFERQAAARQPRMSSRSTCQKFPLSQERCWNSMALARIDWGIINVITTGSSSSSSIVQKGLRNDWQKHMPKMPLAPRKAPLAHITWGMINIISSPAPSRNRVEASPVCCVYFFNCLCASRRRGHSPWTGSWTVSSAWRAHTVQARLQPQQIVHGMQKS